MRATYERIAVTDRVTEALRSSRVDFDDCSDDGVRAAVVDAIDDADRFLDVERDLRGRVRSRFRAAYTRFGVMLLVEDRRDPDTLIAIVVISPTGARKAIESGDWQLVDEAA